MNFIDLEIDEILFDKIYDIKQTLPKHLLEEIDYITIDKNLEHKIPIQIQEKLEKEKRNPNQNQDKMDIEDSKKCENMDIEEQQND